MADFDNNCQLHIPHKDWSPDPREKENLLEIERWANYRLPNCGGDCASYMAAYHDADIDVPTGGGAYYDAHAGNMTKDFECGTLPATSAFHVTAVVDWEYVAAGTFRHAQLGVFGFSQMPPTAISAPPHPSPASVWIPGGPVQTLSKPFRAGEAWHLYVRQDSGAVLKASITVQMFAICSTC